MKQRKGPRPGVRFGEGLRAARLALGMSKADLARAADIDPGFFHRLEEGQGGCNQQIAEAIARAVRKPLSELRERNAEAAHV